MSQSHRKSMTRAEFLAWEAEQSFKWEFDGVQPVAMNGVTIAHSVIQGNLISTFRILGGVTEGVRKSLQKADGDLDGLRAGPGHG